MKKDFNALMKLKQDMDNAPPDIQQLLLLQFAVQSAGFVVRHEKKIGRMINVPE